MEIRIKDTNENLFESFHSARRIVRVKKVNTEKISQINPCLARGLSMWDVNSATGV